MVQPQGKEKHGKSLSQVERVAPPRVGEESGGKSLQGAPGELEMADVLVEVVVTQGVHFINVHFSVYEGLLFFPMRYTELTVFKM